MSISTEPIQTAFHLPTGTGSAAWASTTACHGGVAGLASATTVIFSDRLLLTLLRARMRAIEKARRREAPLLYPQSQ